MTTAVHSSKASLSDFTDLEIRILRNLVDGLTPACGMRVPGFRVARAKQVLRARGALNVADRPTELGRELAAQAQAEGLSR